MPSEFIVPASTVLAALLAFAGVLIVNKTRKPIETQDLWEENRSLRAEVRLQSDRINMIEEKFDKRDTERQRTIQVLTSGVNALLSYLEIVRLAWNTNVEMPPFTTTQQALVDNARDIQK